MKPAFIESVSTPLKQILQERPHRPTDTLLFYDDSWAKYKKNHKLIVGSGNVELSYFANNQQPDGILERSTYAEAVEKPNHDNMVRKLVDLISRDYQKFDRGEIIAFVVCTGFPESHIKDAMGEIGYRMESLPPIVHALRGEARMILDSRSKSRKKNCDTYPRDYLYKQKVGDYAHKIYSNQMRLGKA